MPITQALSTALLHFVWQGFTVAFLLWIALAILRNRSANARYLASASALGVVALLPVVTAWILARNSGTSNSAAALGSAGLQVFAALPTSGGARLAWLSVVQAWALPFWSAGVVVFALRLAWGCRQVNRMRRTGEPAAAEVLAAAGALRSRLRVKRSVGILMTSQADGPSVVGWLRPVILLPAATLMGLSQQQLEAVLAHEFAHIRRHDYLVNLLQNFIETLLFYHPAVWWISGRMRLERELCCDDAAVQSCGDAACYARALTTLEKLRGAGLALAVGSTGDTLLYRIRRLAGLKPRETAPSRLPALAALALGIACLGLNMNWAHAQDQAVAGILGAVRSPDGPGVQVDLGGAAVVERPGVEYPGSAWEQKIGGIVVVELTLDGGGSVSDARVLSGPAELRKAALQSVLEWRFAPAPAGSTRQISINFNWEQAQNIRPEAGHTVTVRGFSFTTAPDNEKVRELEAKLARAREANAAAPQIRELEEQLSQSRKVAAEKHVMLEIPGLADGRTVTRIQIAGLTELQQKQLAERLPVRLGDVLTHDQIEALTSTLQQVNPSLIYSLTMNGAAGVEIRIGPK